MKLVTKSTGSWYNVYDSETGEVIEARLRGALRLKGSRSTNPVVVGDVVTIEGDANGYVISAVEERKNYIIRRASNLSKESQILASNIDKVYIIVTVCSPPTSSEFIDRILVTAQLYNIDAAILINKSDLEADDYLTPIYNMAGYEIRHVSALTGLGLNELRNEIASKTVLFTGNSGVGKSSLINAIDPNLRAKTGEISSYHNRGKHTTTFSEIFRFGDGFLIDTPGVKGFGLIDIDPKELYRSFPDMMQFAHECAFYNCTHTHEPNCAVMAALERGELHESRYESYLKMLENDSVKYR